MKSNNDKKFGRTFFDLIAEHPKPTFFIFLSILLIAIALIVFGIPFKIGNVEVGDKNSTGHDTTVKTNSDTQYSEKPPVIIYPATITRQTKDPGKNISVKSGDTIVTVQNQPANINTGTNNGIIGNNNSLNIKEVQRQLSNQNKDQLINLINWVIANNKVNDSCIKIYAEIGNPESLNHAKQMFEFLKIAKFNLFNTIIQYSTNPPIKGTAVMYNFIPAVENFTGEPKSDCVCIVVGSK